MSVQSIPSVQSAPVKAPEAPKVNPRQDGRCKALVSRVPSDNDTATAIKGILSGGVSPVIDALSTAQRKVAGTLAVEMVKGASPTDIAAILAVASTVVDGLKAFANDRSSSLSKHLPSAGRLGITDRVNLTVKA